jgi:DNA-binding MarR family transcriptional regulator
MKKEGYSGSGKGTRYIYQKYIEPLENQGIIDKVKSVIDRRAWIYSPTEESREGIFS